VSEFTHAGGIVVRSDPQGHRFLLVQSRSNPEHWVLPKGHIDPGETPEQTAVREVREEAGVVGEIVCEVGVDRYTLPDEEVRSLYFRMRFDREAPADEDRELRWLGLADALRTVSFEGSRALIEKAALGLE
jgi:8-oxo-dGTP pyrophosphatase MutT (NUDIX family)